MPLPTVDEAQQRISNQRKSGFEKVRTAVRNGEKPSEVFSREDLEWLFGASVDADLVQLDAEAAANYAARRERAVRAKRADELARMVNVVKLEWARQAADELHQRAIAEARQRLGWSEDE
jgi:hypothetical protein